MAPQLRQAMAAPVALAIDDVSQAHARELRSVLAARGLKSEPRTLLESVEAGAVVTAFAPAEPPTAERAAAIAPACLRAAEARSPIVLLASFPPAPGKAEIEQIAALAYLRAFGAVICHDPDVWLETLVLIATYGLPTGPRIAIVAPPGSWLAASANAMTRESFGLSSRVPPISQDPSQLGPADLALVDVTALPDPEPERVGRALIVPVVARGELLKGSSRLPLVGLRAAVGAATCAGELATRLADQLGPGDPEEVESFSPDRERFQRQIEKLGDCAGDHEAKVLLAAYGIPVTRQAVATTPSAATRVAKKAGYPVELKPWGPDQPSEADGCPVERDLMTAADVRRAFAALGQNTAVIVREAPEPGREARVEIRRFGGLGWMAVVTVAGAAGPGAAPAPVRAADASDLSRLVEASRAGDPEPDRAALADLIRRASYLATDQNQLVDRIELGRVVIHGRGAGAVVADARVMLRSKRVA